MAATATTQPKTNHIGLTVLDYRGSKTTLCAGCGHNAISERIIDAFYEMGMQPERVIKLSGIGQFVHLMRRNLPVIYIIEDNGVYGLTKGQFSATADVGSKLKTGVINDLPPIDTCAMA